MTKNIIKVLWLIVVVGFISLCWWFFHGPWQNVDGLMIHRDAVRFGPIPIVLSIAWFSLFIITIVINLVYTYFRKKIKN